jgi:hypothetical protein
MIHAAAGGWELGAVGFLSCLSPVEVPLPLTTGLTSAVSIVVIPCYESAWCVVRCEQPLRRLLTMGIGRPLSGCGGSCFVLCRERFSIRWMIRLPKLSPIWRKSTKGGKNGSRRSGRVVRSALLKSSSAPSHIPRFHEVRTFS